VGDEAQRTGPWNLQIRVARSSDGGKSFQDAGEWVADQAGAPSAVLGADGILRVYYMAWQDGQNITAVAMRRADSPGDWSYLKLKFEGQDREGNYADPHVVQLSDGRYRMYYNRPAGQRKEVRSAISEDGLHFKQEPGLRFARNGPMESAMVMQVGPRWVLWAGPLGQVAAVSEDGLSFREDADLRIARDFNPKSGVQLPGGGYRVFGSPGKGRSASAFSKDGRSWTMEDGFWPRGEGFDGNGEHGLVQVGRELLLFYTEDVDTSGGGRGQQRDEPEQRGKSKAKSKAGGR
jgi:hypothetical protein